MPAHMRPRANVESELRIDVPEPTVFEYAITTPTVPAPWVS